MKKLMFAVFMMLFAATFLSGTKPTAPKPHSRKAKIVVVKCKYCACPNCGAVSNIQGVYYGNSTLIVSFTAPSTGYDNFSYGGYWHASGGFSGTTGQTSFELIDPDPLHRQLGATVSITTHCNCDNIQFCTSSAVIANAP